MQRAAPKHTYVSFDDPLLRRAAHEDPIGFVNNLPRLVILDEIQHVPELFSAIKLEIDKQRIPGRFIFTGSANIMALPKLSDSLTGRMELIRLHPLARCEIESRRVNVLTKLLSGQIPRGKFNRFGATLWPLIATGGFPESVKRSDARRRTAWLTSYLDTLIQRDIDQLGRVHEKPQFLRLLRLAAAHGAQLTNVSTLSTALQLTRQTTERYLQLLQSLYLVEFLEPWFANRIKRLIKAPKLHLTDTGLQTALLAESLSASSDANLRGMLLEGWVYNELRRQAGGLTEVIQFYYFRDKDQNEVDIVLDTNEGLLGIEVKAKQSLIPRDCAGLKRLQTVAGKQFKLGIIFYDGELVVPLGKSIYAVPLAAL